MKKHIQFVLLGIMMATVGAHAAASNNDAAVASLQKELATLSASVPAQIKQAQTANQAAIVSLQKSIQQQLLTLQKQIQQVQDNMTHQIQAIQKETHQPK